jgi:hypothetical protein
MLAETLLELSNGLTVAGANDTVIPEGAPDALSVISPPKPPPREMVRPALAVPPATPENDDGVDTMAIVPVSAAGATDEPPHAAAPSSRHSAIIARGAVRVTSVARHALTPACCA